MVETFIIITEQVEQANSLQRPQGNIKGSFKVFVATLVSIINKLG